MDPGFLEEDLVVAEGLAGGALCDGDGEEGVFTGEVLVVEVEDGLVLVEGLVAVLDVLELFGLGDLGVELDGARLDEVDGVGLVTLAVHEIVAAHLPLLEVVRELEHGLLGTRLQHGPLEEVDPRNRATHALACCSCAGCWPPAGCSCTPRPSALRTPTPPCTGWWRRGASPAAVPGRRTCRPPSASRCTRSSPPRGRQTGPAHSTDIEHGNCTLSSAIPPMALVISLHPWESRFIFSKSCQLSFALAWICD